MLVSVTGILAFYQTKVPFHRKGKYLGTRDFFGECCAAAKKRGIRVIARMSPDLNWEDALQAHPDINLLVTSSDFLTPQIEQALRTAGKWHPAGHPEHVLVAGFDGDDNGYAQLAAGYWDVDGVQNLDIQTVACCHSPVIEGDYIDKAFARIRALPSLDPIPLPDQSVLDQIVAASAQPQS